MQAYQVNNMDKSVWPAWLAEDARVHESVTRPGQAAIRLSAVESAIVPQGGWVVLSRGKLYAQEDQPLDQHS